MSHHKFSKSMTLTQFENGYWYTSELKDFADSIGIPSAGKLRKDELEKAIKHFLKTRKVEIPTRRSLSKTGPKDVERGLRLALPVINYTNDKETKDFIEREARKVAPGLKKKSGSRYRLNRWREEQLTKGREITYKELIDEYVRLNQVEGSFEKVPHGRYINFLSEFLATEKNATRSQAIRAWEKLKKMDIPKDYRSWVRAQRDR